ncbi:MAG: arylsulfotransferase family protein, partial [Candidatus Latescibacterota bacterium]
LAYNPKDLFHTNSLEVLDGRIAHSIPAFKEGNILLSMCHLDMIAVVDPARRRVVWSMSGAFALQHDPTITDDGGLMLFDNIWQQDKSRIIVLAPASRDVIWQYSGTDEAPFYSQTCGTAKRLPNGNTLISESDNGRAFEVTMDGDIVWEFYNPHRAGDKGQYIATLFEMIRLQPGFPIEWASDSPPAH